MQLLLYKLTKDQTYANGFAGYMNGWFNMRKTPKGLAFFNQWAPNRYAANTAFLALLAADLGLNTDAYRGFGAQQVG